MCKRADTLLRQRQRRKSQILVHFRLQPCTHLHLPPRLEENERISGRLFRGQDQTREKSSRGFQPLHLGLAGWRSCLNTGEVEIHDRAGTETLRLHNHIQNAAIIGYRWGVLAAEGSITFHFALIQKRTWHHVEDHDHVV